MSFCSYFVPVCKISKTAQRLKLQRHVCSTVVLMVTYEVVRHLGIILNPNLSKVTPDPTTPGEPLVPRRHLKKDAVNRVSIRARGAECLPANAQNGFTCGASLVCNVGRGGVPLNLLKLNPKNVPIQQEVALLKRPARRRSLRSRPLFSRRRMSKLGFHCAMSVLNDIRFP